jgi:hypothetical protein
MMAEALEELSTALEELHVASEELRHQNEELAAAANHRGGAAAVSGPLRVCPGRLPGDRSRRHHPEANRVAATCWASARSSWWQTLLVFVAGRRTRLFTSA